MQPPRPELGEQRVGRGLARGGQADEVGGGGAQLLEVGRVGEGIAGRAAADEAKKHDWYDCATFKEPYRVEGKKTMGYELAEQMGWKLPDAILYPTGGGTGLIGMWKAFAEMETMGFVGPARPRMYAVQAEGCAPVVKAFGEGKNEVEFWPDAATHALGLRVPKPYADTLILDAIRQSHGAAIAVSGRLPGAPGGPPDELVPGGGAVGGGLTTFGCAGGRMMKHVGPAFR